MDSDNESEIIEACWSGDIETAPACTAPVASGRHIYHRLFRHSGKIQQCETVLSSFFAFSRIPSATVERLGLRSGLGINARRTYSSSRSRFMGASLSRESAGIGSCYARYFHVVSLHYAAPDRNRWPAECGEIHLVFGDYEEAGGLREFSVLYD